MEGSVNISDILYKLYVIYHCKKIPIPVPTAILCFADIFKNPT